MISWGKSPQQQSNPGPSRTDIRQASGIRAVPTPIRPATQAAGRDDERAASLLRRMPLPDRPRRLLRWSASNPEWTLAMLATVLSVAAYTWYSIHGLTLAYTDAITHMEIARRVVSGRTPGLAQLGSVWLPLHHLLMVPLLISSTLFHDGFAGAFPSMLAYVAGSVYLFRTGRLLLDSSLGGWTAALVFLFNPNVLYMQSTAMEESDMLAAAIVAVFYLVRWSESNLLSDLVKAAVAIAAGTLIRYDGWALALAATAVVAYVTWRRQGPAAIEGYTIFFGLLAFAGCASWLIYNGVIFHDPLYFYSGMYSTQAQQKRGELHAALPTHNNPWLSLHVYSQAVIDAVWWPLAILALLGLVYWAFRSRLQVDRLAVYLVLVPLMFNVLALIRGISVLFTPEVSFGMPTYFNVRYAMMMIPAVALGLGFLAVQSRALMVVVLGLVVTFGTVNSTLATRSNMPYVVQEPLYGVVSTGRITGMRGGEWLAANYHGGSVLITYSHDAGIMFHSGLPDTTFVTEANGEQFRQAVIHPEAHVTWIVLSPEGGNNEIAVHLDRQHNWRRYFTLKQVIGDTKFYERNSSP